MQDFKSVGTPGQSSTASVISCGLLLRALAMYVMHWICHLHAGPPLPCALPRAYVL
jgi:hypothetical protein